MLNPILEPLKKPENWTDFFLAIVVGALAYTDSAPKWLRITLVLAAVGLRVVARWWGDPSRPLPAPAAKPPSGFHPDDPPRSER